MGKSSKARASGKAKARARAKAKARGTMVNVGEMSESSRSLQEHDANVTLSFQLLNVDDSERVSSKFSRPKQEDLVASSRPKQEDLVASSRPKQEDLAALRLKAETLKSKLEDLQILNDRMCGEGVDALSLAELRSLLSPLKQGMLSVENQLAKKRIEQEEIDARMVKQEFGEEGDTDAVKFWIQSKRDQRLKLELLAAKKRSFFRMIGRKLRSSNERRKHWDDFLILALDIMNMKRDIPRLELWNRRMCGEDIDGMDFFELMVLRKQIHIALVYISWALRKRRAEEGRLGNKESIGGEDEHGGEKYPEEGRAMVEK